jgi:hypothetical protein
MYSQHSLLPRIDAAEAIWPGLLMSILAETTIYKARNWRRLGIFPNRAKPAAFYN